jgi:tetratricopeptide (TPR) repeat protein
MIARARGEPREPALDLPDTALAALIGSDPLRASIQCLDENVLQEWAEGGRGTMAAGVLAHASGCARCRELLIALGATAAVAEQPERTDNKKALGRYVLLDQIGAGGMGVVYSAYDPELDRKVALKFVRADAMGRSGAESLARLLREAKALAQLSHPNVIAIHDVGTATDQMYIAEEFVRGKDLAHWLAASQRSVDDVLGVFAQAGRGLAAAHAAALVHRDFKPANVLVGDDGRVRVVDFGMARLTTASAVEAPQATAPPADALASPLTQTGALLGTPLYMPPEQFVGQPADARSDQFSFCVSLYEALYREMPFGGRTFAELEAETRAGTVRTPPKGSAVPGRLREVILRGLSPEPANRFASMEALLAALERSRARPGRRAGAAAGVAVLLAAVSAGAYQWASARRSLCQGAERGLIGVWDADRKAAVQKAMLSTGVPYAAASWSAVEKAVDAYAAGWVAMHRDACEATRIRGEQSEAVMDLRISCLARKRQELQAAAYLLSQADRKVVDRASSVTSALSPVAACADVEALKAPLRPPDDPAARAKVEQARAKIATVSTLSTVGKFAQSLPLAQAALEETQDLHYEPVRAEALLELGRAEMLSGKNEAAERDMSEAFYAGERSRDDGIANQAAVALVNQVGIHERHPAEARQWARMARALTDRLGDQASRGRLDQYEGMLLDYDGKYAEAIAAFRKCLAEREKELGPEHTSVAVTLTTLSNDLANLGQLDEAQAAQRRALAIWEKAMGPDFPEVGTARHNLGGILARMGRYDDALAELRQALAIRLRCYGPEHQDVAATHDSLGLTYAAEHRWEESVTEVKQAVAIMVKALGSSHPHVGFVQADLGRAYDALHRYDDAMAEYRSALSVMEPALGKDHPQVADVEQYVADTLAHQHQAAKALAEYRHVLTVRLKTFGPAHVETAVTLGGMGGAELELGDAAEAMRLLEQALPVLEKERPPEDSLPDVRFALARALAISRKDPERAVRLAHEAREAYAAYTDHAGDVATVDAWLSRQARAAPKTAAAH